MGFCCDVVCSLESFFFFFKQKTAYEMRISDWSSDVCSSDLLLHIAAKRHVGCDTNTAKIGKYLLRGDFRRLAHRHDGDLDAFSFRCVDQHRQPLDPGGPADCGGMRAAERLDQPVIAAAAKHRALRDRKSTRLNSSH